MFFQTCLRGNLAAVSQASGTELRLYLGNSLAAFGTCNVQLNSSNNVLTPLFQESVDILNTFSHSTLMYSPVIRGTSVAALTFN